MRNTEKQHIFGASSLAGVFFALSSFGVQAAPRSEPRPPLPSAQFMVLGNEARPTAAHAIFCQTYPTECDDVTRQPYRIVLTSDSWRQLNSVNQAVNARIRAVTDAEQHGLADYWAQPGPHLTQGDCEEYATEKRRRLIASGYPPSALLLTVVTTRAGEGHAVLVVRTDRGDFVLDNLAPDIRSIEDSGHSFVKTSSPYDAAHWRSVSTFTNNP